MKKINILLILIPIVCFTLGISYIGSENIVNYVGVENSYFFMFIIAFIGGISIFSGVPYPLILITFALGGLNVWYLGLAAASGVMLGDCTSYFIGKNSEKIINGKLRETFDTLLSIYDNHPRALMPLFFIYGVTAPFPNDIITLSSGIKGYGFWKTMIPLSLGNLIFCFLLGNFADFFSKYF